MKQFDYIIAGAGAAGLTLAYLLMEYEDREKSILIIDKDSKNTNDRTWSFWEKGSNLLEHLVYKSWSKATVNTNSWSQTYELAPYTYKMIRGIDFYEFMKQELNTSNLYWIQDEILEITDTGQVTTTNGVHQGKLVFDSTFDPRLLQTSNANTILQHFKGKVIRTEKDCLQVDTATYMDFSVDQEGDCRFGYVLPFKPNEALVEYTLFNKHLLSDSEYEHRLDAYIKQKRIKNYEVIEEEYGIIPMTDHKFLLRKSDKVFNIGIKGGFAKASTGYSFLRAQQILEKVVKNLISGKKPDHELPHQSLKYKLYDATLLKVLADKKYTGREVFGNLFQKNGMQSMFRFLDEETTLTEELKIMSSTPIIDFGRAFFHQLGK